MADDDFCCGCGKRMPENVTDWWIDAGAHMYCSEACAAGGPNCNDD